MLVYGINPVLEALRAGHVSAIRISARDGERVRAIVALAEARGVPTRRVDAAALDRESRGGVHQGVVADLRSPSRQPRSLEDLIATAIGPPLIVVLDGIEDPHNVGAIIRTADVAGATGLVRQTRRAARLDGVAAKASAGAVAYVPVVDVVNIARALDALHEAGVWTVGLAGDAATRYDEVDFTVPSALVLGAEGVGLRRLVRERCDLLASIPLRGHVDSLNVSVAAGVALFEAVRQRDAARGR